MVSSTRHAIICILVVLGSVVCIQAQTTAKKPGSGSISGRVTIKGKPAVGVTVVAYELRNGMSSNVKPYRVRTDQTGSYRLTNLPAGTYEISPIAPALVPANETASIVVADGEEVENVDLVLVPGGVITGRITDSEGEPIIGMAVNITPDYEQFPSRFNRTLLQRYSAHNGTDDRGVYRVFGLPRGKYKVSVGSSGSGVGNAREYYKETFYPSGSDAAKATVIEVTEGSEANHVDIVVGRPAGTYRIAGRVVDESGRPVPNIKYGVGQRYEHGDSSGSSSSVSGAVTNANGEFRLENVTPGKYTIFTAPTDGSDIPAASVSFEVVDRDLTDLLIKTTRGSSLSGVVVLDGNERALNVLGSLQVCATVQSTQSDFAGSPSSAIGNDGSFRINGVRSGLVGFWLCYANDKRQRFELVRVERNGIAQSEPIKVKPGEDVAGLRIVVKYIKLTGAIRGQVKVENGELPPASQLSLMLWPLDENLERKRTSSLPHPELDARGRFFVAGLAAGAYEVTVYVVPQGQGRISDTKTQQVIVTEDAVSEVTLTINPTLN